MDELFTVQYCYSRFYSEFLVQFISQLILQYSTTNDCFANLCIAILLNCLKNLNKLRVYCTITGSHKISYFIVGRIPSISVIFTADLL
jgi:hypothetical protein